MLKVASRCNLNCSYCYMYNLGDKTYLDQPKFMTLETITALAERLQAYCKNADIGSVQIVFHGGEPLLLGREYFQDCLEIFRQTAPAVEFSYIIQTNGVNLDRDWYEWLNANKVKVGISIDGPVRFHDAYRVFHNGKGSYDQVAAAVRLGVGNGLIGILSVLNIAIPVGEYYQEMKSLSIKSLNLLFPDGHYDKLPEAFDKSRFGNDDYTPFGDWLIELFLIWKKDKGRPAIKLFENLIAMLLGEDRIGNQAFGIRKNGVAVIETNGGVEVVDSLRACYEGITRNDINLHTNKIEDIFENDVFDVYYHAHEMVCEQCSNCPIYEMCGGGFLGSRFANKTGFDNPTIYCKDIIRLTAFIQNDLIDGLPADSVSQTGVVRLSYEQIIQDLKKPASVKIKGEVKKKLTSFKQPDSYVPEKRTSTI